MDSTLFNPPGRWIGLGGSPSIADPAATIGGPVFIPAQTTTSGTWSAGNYMPKITYSTAATSGTKNYSAANLMKAVNINT